MAGEFEKYPDEANPVVLDTEGYDTANPIVVEGKLPQGSTYVGASGGFNLNAFKTEFSQDNVIATHSYLVTFAPFKSTSTVASELSQFIGSNSSTLSMRCDSAILPGIRLMKDETIRRHGYGPIERVPYSAQVNEITLSWILDGNAKILAFFDAWMHAIVNYDSAGGGDMLTPRTIGSLSYSPYELGYKDNYACPKMNIFVYDRRMNTVVIYEIFDVFPSAINDVPVHWGEQDTLMKHSIEFSFTDLNIQTPRALSSFPSSVQETMTDNSLFGSFLNIF